eukprot:5092872-Ditylum_brightwellii.AAC.1
MEITSSSSAATKRCLEHQFDGVETITSEAHKNNKSHQWKCAILTLEDQVHSLSEQLKTKDDHIERLRNIIEDKDQTLKLEYEMRISAE